MKNRMSKLMLAMVLGAALVIPQVQVRAQDAAADAQVTQAELAQMLVNLMGLARFLPSPSTPQENFAALISNGVSPEAGWAADEVVTKAVLARVIVQAMGAADEVANPDDPNSWVAYLKENGIPIDTVGEAVQNVEPVAEPVADYVMGAGTTSDPLKKQAVFGLPDEKQFGADLERAPGQEVVAQAPPAPPVVVPPPVTPPRVRPPTRDEVVDIIRRLPIVRPPTTRPTPDGGDA